MKEPSSLLRGRMNAWRHGLWRDGSARQSSEDAVCPHPALGGGRPGSPAVRTGHLCFQQSHSTKSSSAALRDSVLRDKSYQLCTGIGVRQTRLLRKTKEDPVVLGGPAGQITQSAQAPCPEGQRPQHGASAYRTGVSCPPASVPWLCPV